MSSKPAWLAEVLAKSSAMKAEGGPCGSVIADEGAIHH
jgi:hypothetical protein